MDSFIHHQHEELQIKEEPIDQLSVLPSTENTNIQYKDLHIKSESNDQGFKCEICDKSFASEENRQVHVQIHQDSLDEGENSNKFQCSLCPLIFDAAEDLKKHCFSTHYQGRHQCQLCPQKFVKKMHAYEHLKQGNLLRVIDNKTVTKIFQFVYICSFLSNSVFKKTGSDL